MVAALKRVVSRDGKVEWHHLRSLYPMPVSPSAELLDVVASVFATSLSVMGEKVQVGKGGGHLGVHPGWGWGP